MGRKIKRVADLTEYPHIFEKEYWGHSPITEGLEDYMGRHVIENRNDFVREFHIHWNIASPPYRVSVCFMVDGMDHFEVYAAEDGYVLVVSNYNDIDIPKAAKILGFRAYKDIYGFGAKSFVTVIPYEGGVGKINALVCAAHAFNLLHKLYPTSEEGEV